MGYVFRIHDAKHNGAAQPKNAADVKDWTETNYIDKTFLPNIALGMTGDEMGTSIPSMFARLFYFQSAFKALNGSRIHVWCLSVWTYSNSYISMGMTGIW